MARLFRADDEQYRMQSLIVMTILMTLNLCDCDPLVSGNSSNVQGGGRASGWSGPKRPLCYAAYTYA